eukprot:TRINITY_DN105182_c0_g1_i1.p1 TRINITY_DN105182_c0_g1~~TRINITY_DN105182_c0_g1_i1.p1  ORF type:complete len:952 (+),score=146.58 TRINITY_DN105182_c0_g1_i1:144-2999(+)
MEALSVIPIIKDPDFYLAFGPVHYGVRRETLSQVSTVFRNYLTDLTKNQFDIPFTNISKGSIKKTLELIHKLSYEAFSCSELIESLRWITPLRLDACRLVLLQAIQENINAFSLESLHLAVNVSGELKDEQLKAILAAHFNKDWGLAAKLTNTPEYLEGLTCDGCRFLHEITMNAVLAQPTVETRSILPVLSAHLQVKVWKEANSEATKQIQEYLKHFEEKIKAIEGTERDTSKQEIMEKLKEVNEKERQIEETMNKMRISAKAREELSMGEIETMNEKLEEYKKNLDKLKSETINIIKNNKPEDIEKALKEEINDKTAALEDKLQKEFKRITTPIEAIKTEFSNQISTLSEKMREYQNTISQELKSKAEIQHLDPLKQQVAKKDLETKISDIEKGLQQFIKERNTSMYDQLYKEVEALNAELSQNKLLVEDIMTKVKELQGKINTIESLKTIKEEVNLKIEETEIILKQMLENSLEAQEKEFLVKLQEITDELQVLHGALRGEVATFDEKLDKMKRDIKVESEYKNSMDKFKKELEEKIEKVNELVAERRRKDERTTNETKRYLNQLEANWTKLNEKFEENIKRIEALESVSRSSSNENVKETVKEVQSRLENLIIALKQEQAATHSAVEHRLNLFLKNAETSNEAVKAKYEAISKTINQQIARIDTLEKLVKPVVAESEIYHSNYVVVKPEDAKDKDFHKALPLPSIEMYKPGGNLLILYPHEPYFYKKHDIDKYMNVVCMPASKFAKDLLKCKPVVMFDLVGDEWTDFYLTEVQEDCLIEYLENGGSILWPNYLTEYLLVNTAIKAYLRIKDRLKPRRRISGRIRIVNGTSTIVKAPYSLKEYNLLKVNDYEPEESYAKGAVKLVEFLGDIEGSFVSVKEVSMSRRCFINSRFPASEFEQAVLMNALFWLARKTQAIIIFYVIQCIIVALFCVPFYYQQTLAQFYIFD